MAPNRVEDCRQILRRRDSPEKPRVQQDMKSLEAAEINLQSAWIDCPPFEQKRTQALGCFQRWRHLYVIQVNGQERRPDFSLITGNARRRVVTLSAHVSQNFVGEEKVGGIAAVVVN